MDGVRDSYRKAVAELVVMLRRTGVERQDQQVPACPEWSVADVVRHLCGVTSDVVARRMDGAPGPRWTGRQVEERRDRDLLELLDELTIGADQVPVAALELAGPNPYWDVVVHTADVAEALGLPRLAGSVWGPVLTGIIDWRGPRYSGPGKLVVLTESGCALFGQGDEEVSVAVEDYELFRGLSSRRSRRQISAWPWSHEPGGHVAALPMFGERTDDQPAPSS